MISCSLSPGRQEGGRTIASCSQSIYPSHSESGEERRGGILPVERERVTLTR